MALTVSLRDVRGADPAQRAFIERGIARLGEAVGDPGFLAAMAAADYVETRWTPLHGQWRALTGAEIAARIAAGTEHAVRLAAALGCQPIHPARWFVDRCMAAGDAVNLASHFMHEWMHLSGFFHWPDNKARGDAAYVAGRLVLEALEPKYGAEIDPAITALMHDRETDCGCRGNPAGGVVVGQPSTRSCSTGGG